MWIHEHKDWLMLEDNFKGFISTSKYAKIAKCSNDSALRDIQELKERGILILNPSGGRSTSYRLVDNLPLRPPRLKICK